VKIDSTSFVNNSALIKGGAIHNFNIEPIISSSVTFKNNDAGQYGDLFSSEAHRLIHIPEQYIDRILETSFVDQKIIQMYANEVIEFKRFKSGSKVGTMYFGLIDLYGNLLTTNSKAMLFVEDISNTQSLVYQGLLEYSNSISGTFYTAVGGIFTVD
jgi:predicted outer membrane repeat protein